MRVSGSPAWGGMALQRVASRSRATVARAIESADLPRAVRQMARRERSRAPLLAHPAAVRSASPPSEVPKIRCSLLHPLSSFHVPNPHPLSNCRVQSRKLEAQGSWRRRRATMAAAAEALVSAAPCVPRSAVGSRPRTIGLFPAHLGEPLEQRRSPHPWRRRAAAGRSRSASLRLATSVLRLSSGV